MYYTEQQQQQEPGFHSSANRGLYAALSHLNQVKRTGPELPPPWLPVITAMKEAELAKQGSEPLKGALEGEEWRSRGKWWWGGSLGYFSTVCVCVFRIYFPFSLHRPIYHLVLQNLEGVCTSTENVNHNLTRFFNAGTFSSYLKKQADTQLW